MNSAEEISKYSDNNSHYRSPTLARRSGTEIHDPVKPKKDKKWSLGGFFRRKKKDVESESSSEEETPQKRGFLQRRKQRKEDKRKKRANKSLGHFDHIVVTPLHYNGTKEDESGGIFSEPAISNYNSVKASNERIPSRESLSKRQDLNLSRGSLGSQDSVSKKSRREKAKARAEALRDRMKNDSSSDEGSQRSTASSITKFKSDDSLSKKDGTSRKSRAARTERYNRRLTKEDENILNKEADVEKQKNGKDESQSKVQVNRWVVVDEMPKSPPIKPYIKPTLNYSPSVPLNPKSYTGISTIPPSHSIIHRTTSNLSDGPRNYFNSSHKPANIYTPIRHPVDPMRSAPRSFSNSYQDFKPEHRSFSYDCNINRSPIPGSEEQVLYVHFPIGKPVPKQRNPNLINNTQNIKGAPPPPPPRDPQRRIFTNQYENTRPMSYAFENGSQSRPIPVPVHQATIDRNASMRSFNTPPITGNINRAHSFGWQNNYRSNSEDHIIQSNLYQPPIINRPASATPDAPQQRFIRRHPNTDQYKYFAEKTPRSRKPIHIAATQPDQTYLSDSQVVTRNYSPRHAVSEFWKQKDAEEINRRKSQLLEQKDKEQKLKKEEKKAKKNFAVLSIPVKTADSLSSLTGSSDTSPLNAKPFFEPTPEPSQRPLSILSEKSEAPTEVSESSKKKDPPDPPLRRYSRQSSASSTENNWNNEEQAEKKRRNSNLEDALDELEAIYKSLRLGDEDLLDRAEIRDVPSAVTEKLLTTAPDSYVNWGNHGTMSDSGFNYDFDCIDGLRKKRSPRKSTIPDKLNDDMAYRRLNKERPPPLDPQVAVSQVSYLLASPVLGAPPVDENDNESVKTTDEPDIMLDDVVYRSIKHTNNSLKVSEPQLPFGIPIGPITAAANSDYLHAVPENNNRPRFIPRKSPDLVKDDLAYRSLRKDNPFAADDYINNNNATNNTKPDYLKKRKAVRSISANIYNLMHRDNLRSTESDNEFDKAQSLTDIADAMEIARQILKERQEKIYRKSVSSDTESKLLKPLNCSNTATSTETITETKLNDLKESKTHLTIPGSEDILNQKPPICPTPDKKSSKPPTKESTPTRISPAPDINEDNILDNNHLSDLLTAFAIEARETSEKLGNDLKLLDEEQSRKPSPRISQTTTPSRDGAESPVVSKSLDEKLSDIDAVSEHAKLCEKLLGAVVESTKLISHSVQPAELEEVSEIVEPTIYKSVANIIVTRNADAPKSDPRSEQNSESEHDYENIPTEEEKCTSPFVENKIKLLADFEELKKDFFSDDDAKVDEEVKDLCAKEEQEEEAPKLQDSCSEGELRGTSCGVVVGSRVVRPVSCGSVPLALMSSSTSVAGAGNGSGSALGSNTDARAERVARYKEERRKQLAAQAATKVQATTPPRRYITRPKSSSGPSTASAPATQAESPSSGSEGVAVRTTRASRLRAARLSVASGPGGTPGTPNGGPGGDSNGGQPENGKSPTKKVSDKERSPLSISASLETSCGARVSRQEKDKSSKRKSNLNRSLNAEDTPNTDLHDDSLASRRRRRRALNPNDILTSLNESGLSSGSTSTSARVTPLPSPSANHVTSPRTPTSIPTLSLNSPSPRKTELSIHMENARRGVTKRVYTSSPRKKTSTSEQEEYFSFSDKEKDKNRRGKAASDNEQARSRVIGDKKVSVTSASKTTDISKRLDEVTACTKETLARVERLTQRNQQSPRREVEVRKKSSSKSPEKVIKNKVANDATNEKSVDLDHQNHNGYHDDSSKPSSILKKKSQDEPVVPSPPLSVHIHGPISILKRKSSQDDAGSSSASSFATPPVTFSPTVVDPVPSRRKPGILKKRCSLDESHVIRRRSYSPDVALVEGSSDYRPILKNQRRSSLEEIIRTRSPDYQPQGILKRKHSRGEEEFNERSLGSPEPQSILKRKSGTSSSGSSGNSPHVSIATAVILAAAGGAEIILEPSEPVKPILKKKSISEENPSMDSLNPEVPKPILKKKSSTETDDQEDKPMKPILKTSRKCSQDDNYSSRESQDYGIDSPRIYSVLRNRSTHNSGESSSECETAVRPILKQSSSRENSPRPRLSFCSNDEESKLLSSPRTRSPDSATKRSKFVRRSNTVADADLSSILNMRRSFEGRVEKEPKEDDSGKDDVHVPKRPISVFELVLNFEKTNGNTSTGAIPKRSSLKGSRNSGRFRTQPITFDELEATQSLDPVLPRDHSTSPHHSSGESHSLDLTCSTLSLSNDSQLTTPSSVPNESGDSGVASKMEDVSREDDLEDQEDKPREEGLVRSGSVSAKASMFKQLEDQMRKVAEEAKSVRLGKSGNRGVQRYRNRKQASTNENRFSTQPVTLDEVQEAVRANQRTSESPEVDTPAPSTSNPEMEDSADPCKLTLAERVKLFNQKITQERLPVAPGGGPGGIVRKPRLARFKTQPVTSEEVETAQARRVSPLMASLVKPPEDEVLAGLSIRAAKDKIFEHASKMLTSEVRGILKSKSAISPIPTSSPSPEELTPSPRTILKDSQHTNGNHESSEDEGVSTEETSSGSDVQDKKKKKRDRDSCNEKENNREIETVNNKRNLSDSLRLKVDECVKEMEIRNKVRRHLEEVQQMSSSEGTPQTSDGESSGGREVKRIIANDAVARRRQAAINRQKEKSGQLIKSKSHSSIPRSPHPLITLSKPPHPHSTSPSTVSPFRVSPSGDAGAVQFVRGGVRRSLTLPLRPASATGDMPGGSTIADRLAELQHAGNNDWRKRIPKLNTANDELLEIVSKNLYNESLTVESESKSSILAVRKEKLDASSQQWKKRVEVSDAVNFSVAGRMHQEVKELPVSPLTVAAQDKKKRTPKAARFKGKEGETKTISTPVSPEKNIQIKFKRSISAPGVGDEENDSDTEPSLPKTEGRRVVVPRPDDETFTTFFESVTKSTGEHLEVTEDDLDSVTRQNGALLVTKRTVRVQRKHAGTARNPIKALAARTDIKEEYTEVITGVAEREKRRINVEKLAKHSSMAIEALAGLASKEDFTAISLKKSTTNSSSALLPYKDLMLLHIKGRRHVQTRLVEPIASSINKGDNYVLVTPTQVYNYVGTFSNIIEQSRGAEIAQHIQQKKDLGCKCNDVITIHEGKSKCSRSHLEIFWKLLGSVPDETITEAGHPDEDEIYESAMIDTNMVYELDNNELVPLESYWGSLPKIEMLDSSKVLVFDYGTEMYIWSGRSVSLDQRKEGAKLAKELWEEGYNYSECAVCPINAVQLLGRREMPKVDKKANSRPDWALLCKITQHGETILFREKFLDWPDFSRVIKVKNKEEKTVDGSISLKPCPAEDLRNSIIPPPDLLLEGSHLGRGTNYCDEETSRCFEISTLGLKAWHILEYEYEELPAESIGMFYNGDSYVIRWQYMLTVTGRELSGKPSKHLTTGRDRCAYFCWQGKDAPLNEKGAAALLTVELDYERGPQVRVTQGAEPPAFLNLFKGLMTVHSGRRENTDNPKSCYRLYMCRGELENEVHLIEVACSMRQLRSRGCFLLINSSNGSIIIWNGCKSLKHHRNLAMSVAKKIKELKPVEFNIEGDVTISEVDEGMESTEFTTALNGGNRNLYFNLLKSPHSFDTTPRMFHLSSISGVFTSNEIASPHNSDEITPYPFIQSDLYGASQPALFLIDNGHELWLWQGWWPETDSDSDSDSDRPYSDQTGSGQHRWQAERRAAMQTTLDYWQGPKDKTVPAHLVWAGLEPLEFTNLFPTWTDRDDIAELNIRDGRKPGEILKVENELARLTQSTYPLVQLLQRPLPEGVDPTHLEDYLSGEDFMSLLGMTKLDFQKLPTWKQTNIKKDTGLF